MANALRCLLFVFIAVVASLVAMAEEAALPKPESNRLRLFNTEIFGSTVDKPVLLMKPASPGQIDPETIMVDVDKGKYIAATVRYPKKMSLAEARHSLNTVYAKYESETFADDPTMGIWRNEDDRFSIQLTEEEDTLAVIYIKYSLLTEEKIRRSFSRALRDIEKDEGKGS